MSRFSPPVAGPVVPVQEHVRRVGEASEALTERLYDALAAVLQLVEAAEVQVDGAGLLEHPAALALVPVEVDPHLAAGAGVLGQADARVGLGESDLAEVDAAGVAHAVLLPGGVGFSGV